MTELFSSTIEKILAIRNLDPPRQRQMLWEGDRLLEKVECLNLAEALTINGELKSEIKDFMVRCEIIPRSFNNEPIKDVDRVRLTPTRALGWIFNCQAKLLGELVNEDIIYEIEFEGEAKNYDAEFLYSPTELSARVS